MIKTLKHYRREIFCLLLSTAVLTSAWMASLVHDIQQKNKPGFSIMDLELPKSDTALLSSINDLHKNNAVKEIQLNLRVDYIFMPAIYLLIACWLLMIKKNTNKKINIILTILAFAQLLPWIFDIIENNHLLNAINTPGYSLGMDLYTFKKLVTIKFIISIGGAAVALLVCIVKIFKPKFASK